MQNKEIIPSFGVTIYNIKGEPSCKSNCDQQKRNVMYLPQSHSILNILEFVTKLPFTCNVYSRNSYYVH